MCILQPICLPLPEASTIVMDSTSLGADTTFIIGLMFVFALIYSKVKKQTFLNKKYLFFL